MAPVTRQEVERVKTVDRNFNGYQGVLHARILAVAGAQQAVAAGEVGARYALRQLAAAAELVAADLPAPAAERVRVGQRAGWNVGD